MARARDSIPDSLAILMMLEGNAKRYEVLGRMTRVIWNAAKVNKSINLDIAFREDRRGRIALNNELRGALGVFEENLDGELVPTDGWAEFLANPTRRTNFATRLKLCAQAAAGLIDMKARVEMDDGRGTLVISGPSVEKAFGKNPVWLDEKMA